MEVTQGLGVIAFLAALVAVVYFVGRNEVVKRRLACPHQKTIADVDVVQRYHEPELPVRVKSCNLLPGDVVDCGQDCLEQIG